MTPKPSNYTATTSSVASAALSTSSNWLRLPKSTRWSVLISTVASKSLMKTYRNSWTRTCWRSTSVLKSLKRLSQTHWWGFARNLAAVSMSEQSRQMQAGWSVLSVAQRFVLSAGTTGMEVKSHVTKPWINNCLAGPKRTKPMCRSVRSAGLALRKTEDAITWHAAIVSMSSAGLVAPVLQQKRNISKAMGVESRWWMRMWGLVIIWKSLIPQSVAKWPV